ncbi:MAG: hypothetical protein JW939_00035 [Candidatus Thermoplasmatota archaeon]|nr:hypothetical protein [Candidatus Thermoplasmatota archaeon]
MTTRSIIIFRVYQISTHKTLGFHTGDEEAVVMFCNLKYDIPLDDLALERVPVRQVTKSEVLCFGEVLSQLRAHKQRIMELEEQAEEVGMKDEVVQFLQEVPIQ